ncbi:MAG: PilZ domain-containing protein [Candidatus Acidiferrales bacterium]
MRESKHDKAASERSKSTKYAGGTQVVERRQSVRFQFTASAQVVDRLTGARFSTRTTDLGPGGCFVDTLVPFPEGTVVHISLSKGQNTFETDGYVVYSQTGLGMGLAFSDLVADQATALRDWLKEVTAEREATFEILRTARNISPRAPSNGSEKAMIVRMVHLLVGKGMLTEAEGSAVLYEPVL